MAFVCKTEIEAAALGADLTFHEKTMYGGKTIAAGDTVYLFASDHRGGRGLAARGVVLAAARGPGIRVTITVRPTARSRGPLGRAELKPWRGVADGSPQAELDFKFYRQATHKIGKVSEATAAWLEKFF